MIFGAARPRRPRNPPRPSRRDRVEPLPNEPLPPKLIPSIRQLLSTTASLAHTRIALAGIELEEEMQRLIRSVVLGLVAMVAAFLALVVGTFTIVFAVAPEYRLGTMIGITLVYLVVAVVSILTVRSIFANRPPIFAATLAELEKDKETLSQMSRAHEAAEEARERDRTRQREEDTFVAGRSSNARRGS